MVIVENMNMNTARNLVIGLSAAGTLATATPAFGHARAEVMIRKDATTQVADDGPVAKALESSVGVAGMALVGGLVLWDIRRLLKRR